MTQKILLFAGPKQSGKTSAAKFVTGYVMTQLGRQGVPLLPTRCIIDDDGHLIVNAMFTDLEGTVHDGEGVLDLNRTDSEFKQWSQQILHPHVKIYSFASYLKEAAINIFGLERDKVFGNDEDKNSPTDIKFSDLGRLLAPRTINKLKKDNRHNAFMTHREFLQYFGTDICRKIKDKCWIEACFRQISEDKPEIAVIDDGRFKNELVVAREMGSMIIKLGRMTGDLDDHPSEKEIVKLPAKYADKFVDNQDMNIQEKNQIILDLLYHWGWMSAHIGLGE